MDHSLRNDLVDPSGFLADSLEPIADTGALPLQYWQETRRPFCNLIFLLPMLFIYEIGVSLGSGPRGESIRNGADAWMRLWLQRAGVEMVWILPWLLVGILIAWHVRSRQRWAMKWDTLGGMAAESLMYAFILIMLGQLTDYGFRHAGRGTLQLEANSVSTALLVRVVTFMGAGIYEEFLFRLCFLPLAYAAFRSVMVPRGWAIAGTIVSSSIIFSLAHYLGPTSDGQALAMLTDAVVRVQSSRELWFGFVFRTLAGMFFAALYFLRGFGITVGAHAAYDVFVGVILVNEI